MLYFQRAKKLSANPVLSTNCVPTLLTLTYFIKRRYINDHFSYGVNMECENFNFNIGTSCRITCNGFPNVAIINCECNKDQECNWDKRRYIKKKGIKCITENDPKYGRKRFMQKLKDRSGINFF